VAKAISSYEGIGFVDSEQGIEIITGARSLAIWLVDYLIMHKIEHTVHLVIDSIDVVCIFDM
jgi:hypothetical protein